MSSSVASDLAPRRRRRISGSTSLIRYARVLRESRSSNEDMKRVRPNGDGILTLLCTMRTSSPSIRSMNSLSWTIPKSVVRISFIASLTITDSSIFLCLFMICSALTWNCLGLTSSAPILLGLSILLEETSRNRFANNCESIRYLFRISSLRFPRKTSGMRETSTSWLNFAMNPFSSKESSCTIMSSLVAIPAKR